MQVKDVMTPNADFVGAERTLQEAAEVMKDKGIGELPVVMGKDAVGIVTDRDITIRGVAHGLDPRVATVVDVMTEGLVACREEDTLEAAAGIMGERKIRRLPVMDAEGKMSGVVSLGDLALKLDRSVVGEALMEISR